MDDFLYNTSNVAIALGEIKGAESSRVFVMVGVCFELECNLAYFHFSDRASKHTIA